MASSLRQMLLGVPINPLNPNLRKHILLIALLAWVGLGADALSSVCYGPEEAYLALGANTHLALYVAVLTVFTIFIISLGYNQVIELFPGGGGGYKVATKLLHPYVGLVAGSALIVDYILTITISVASGADAVFSFLSPVVYPFKMYVEILALGFLLFLNMRGVKDAIKVLLPVFLGFIFLHVFIIVYGIATKTSSLSTVLPLTWDETRRFALSAGWLTVIGSILHAYSLGAGTYTGLEAVSNNVQFLAEPRVRTAKRTMLYMALSLSFTAGGIILLYLLWNAHHVPGQTLNAVVFQSILGSSSLGHVMWLLILGFEAALLLIAANTGFVAGPAVLANMAVDEWVPSRFRLLSNRLVIENGLMLFGVAAILVLLLTQGRVATLVVLYSINVFVTFTLSLLGISLYRFKHRHTPHWPWHFFISSFACLVTTSMLAITLYYKFGSGGWLTLILTSSIVLSCLVVKRHYRFVTKRLQTLERHVAPPLPDEPLQILAINPKHHTAIFFVREISIGMHTLQFVLRMFPDQFKNFVFLTVGVVDIHNFQGDNELEEMQTEVNKRLEYFIAYCRQHGFAAEGFAKFGTDHIAEAEDLIDKVSAKYPNAIFFASQLILANDNMFTRFLHNQTSFILQEYLHAMGKEVMIVPMKI